MRSIVPNVFVKIDTRGPFNQANVRLSPTGFLLKPIRLRHTRSSPTDVRMAATVPTQPRQYARSPERQCPAIDQQTPQAHTASRRAQNFATRA